jgi:hypothetical protein
LAECGFCELVHRPYPSDRTLSDVVLFGNLAESSRGSGYTLPDKLQDAIGWTANTIRNLILTDAIASRRRRLKIYIEKQNEYLE